MKKLFMLLIISLLCNCWSIAQSAKNIISGELGIWKYKSDSYPDGERHINAATTYYRMLNPNFGLGLKITAIRGTGNTVSSVMRVSTDLVTRWNIAQNKGFRWMTEAGLSVLEEATYFRRDGFGECGLGHTEEYTRRLSSNKNWFHDATYIGLAVTNRLEYRMFYDNWIGLSLSNNTYLMEKKVKMLFVPSVAVLHGF